MTRLYHNLVASISLLVAGFLALGATAVHLKAERDARPPTVVIPDASQARAVCREFIERKAPTVVPVFYPNWRVKAPAHGSGRWQVIAEFQAVHGSGVTTHHRMLCVVDHTPGTRWKLEKLV